MSGGSHFVGTWLRCGVCGFRAHIFRKESRQKKRGHVKHMWCSRCRKVTAHYEERED